MSGRGAGKLDRRISIERLSAGAVNALNEPAEVWAHYVWAWAHKRDVSDAEAMAAGEEGSARRARFTVRSNAKTRTVTSDDRIILGGETWNITGVIDLDQARRAYRQITAVVDSDV